MILANNQETIFADRALIDMVADCHNSTKAMAELFFQERFWKAFSPLHDRIFDLIDSGHPKIVIAAPRGIGKTSIVGLALCARSILLRLRKFIVYISNSATSAELQTENLKHELMTNRMIKEMFGSLKVKRPDGMDESFSRRAWVSAPLLSRESGEVEQDGTLILPRGQGQQVRGILYHNSRPDLLIFDDLENTESVMNEELRAKLKKWFFSDVIKAVSRVDKNYQYIYIDTLKHEDSLLEFLLTSSDWKGIRLEICDDNLKSTAPGFMSDEEVVSEHASHKEKGLLDVFYQEFRNIPTSKEDAVFKPEYFRYYREDGDRLRIMVEPTPNQSVRYFEDGKEIVSKSDLLNVILVDPAKTVKLQSADSAVLGIGIDRTSRKIFVRDVVSGKYYPDELLDEMFQMTRNLNARYIGVEVTSLHQWISQPIENEMRVRSILAQYIELKAVGKKPERISHLAPFYKLGYIYHNVTCYQKLESQLESFPNSKLWDVMDALAYIVKFMDIIDIYFDSDDWNGDDEDIESEYDEIDNEESLDLDIVVGI